MAVIFRATDRIKVKIDDINFVFSPLSLAQKQILFQDVKDIEKDPSKALEFSKNVLKMSLKDIENVQDLDGGEYKLEFADGLLSNAALDDLLNLDCLEKLLTVAGSLMQKVPQGAILNPLTGLPMEGVELLKKT